MKTTHEIARELLAMPEQKVLTLHMVYEKGPTWILPPPQEIIAPVDMEQKK